MKRKAILIESSDVSGESDLPGARVDILNWEHFLKSDLGGAWIESEIEVHRKPFSSDIERAINASSGFEYVLVAFSGHGCDGSVVLNDYNKGYATSQLKPKAARGVLIVDACRGVTETGIITIRAKAAALNESKDRAFIANSLRGVETELSSADLHDMPYTHRGLWESAFVSGIYGAVQMLACSKGEGAGENPKAGGYYTSLLLQGASVWDRNGSGNVYFTKQAHDYASQLLPVQQTPEYIPAHLRYPFAVAKR